MVLNTFLFVKCCLRRNLLDHYLSSYVDVLLLFFFPEKFEFLRFFSNNKINIILNLPIESKILINV